MTTLELSQHIGRTGSIKPYPGMLVSVGIVDVKMAWGKIRYQIEPACGRGRTWIDAESINLDQQGKHHLDKGNEMTEKHTPGPWEAGTYKGQPTVFDSRGNGVHSG